MPHGYMDLAGLARLLGVDTRRAERMAQRGEIPCQKVGGRLRFNRTEVTEWLQQQMGSMAETHLDNVDAGITEHREVSPSDLIISPLLRPAAVSPHLAARTRNSVLKELVVLAGATDLLYDADGLLEALHQREELCSTAMAAGIAIPHPRRPLQYAVAKPILVIANTVQGIGFGAPDGHLTDLFFMTCSQDDHHHLHILARLCRMLNNSSLPDDLRLADCPDEMIELIRTRELEVFDESS